MLKKSRNLWLLKNKLKQLKIDKNVFELGEDTEQEFKCY